MRHRLPLLVSLTVALAVCAGPASATARFDAAVDALSAAYFRSVPEAATYNGAPEALAPGASARLNDRSPAGDHARTTTTRPAGRVARWGTPERGR